MTDEQTDDLQGIPSIPETYDKRGVGLLFESTSPPATGYEADYERMVASDAFFRSL